MAKVCKSVLKLHVYKLTPQIFSINILCFMSNLSFKGDTLYRLIPSGGIFYSSHRIVLWGIQCHGSPAKEGSDGCGPHPVSTGIFPHSLPEWAFRARPGLWRICLCPKVARIAEQKFGSR